MPPLRSSPGQTPPIAPNAPRVFYRSEYRRPQTINPQDFWYIPKSEHENLVRQWRDPRATDPSRKYARQKLRRWEAAGLIMETDEGVDAPSPCDQCTYKHHCTATSDTQASRDESLPENVPAATAQRLGSRVDAMDDEFGKVNNVERVDRAIPKQQLPQSDGSETSQNHGDHLSLQLQYQTQQNNDRAERVEQVQYLARPTNTRPRSQLHEPNEEYSPQQSQSPSPTISFNTQMTPDTTHHAALEIRDTRIAALEQQVALLQGSLEGVRLSLRQSQIALQQGQAALKQSQDLIDELSC
ncbi:hypothetical protein K461DRAFT_306161 [Myriangium duriaei CBS 260.36]|uniref:Uncharacterized protein n=1 Tax=Myriangium duriaei CBS 260.36 TaxID=1168546 RepID=A0A9P4J6W7_9PEZI|nr:hypothetical protein K461DRAFT_306161 [Myriangium duriaei CBS 260.36]